jgi:CDP-diacylglycerol--glycerol-3-phosphate 3-phosphatidyltransferase
MFFGFNVVFFHLTMLILTIDALEESVLVFLLPEWRNDVKGIWWVLKAKSQEPK